jgi:hypothetical protein
VGRKPAARPNGHADLYVYLLTGVVVPGDNDAPGVEAEAGSVNPLLSFTPDSLNELVEQVANLAAEKVEERTWPHWMDAKTAGRYTSLPVKAITNRCEDGRIQGRKVSGRWIVARAELDRYMMQGP